MNLVILMHLSFSSSTLCFPILGIISYMDLLYQVLAKSLSSPRIMHVTDFLKLVSLLFIYNTF